MSQRQRMTKQQSKRSFSRGANRLHKRNLPPSPVMRGGIRL